MKNKGGWYLKTQIFGRLCTAYTGWNPEAGHIF